MTTNRNICSLDCSRNAREYLVRGAGEGFLSKDWQIELMSDQSSKGGPTNEHRPHAPRDAGGGRGRTDRGNASAAGFDWKRFNGSQLRFMVSVHPWTEWAQKQLPALEAETGIKVNLEILYEDQLRQKLPLTLRSRPRRGGRRSSRCRHGMARPSRGRNGMRRWSL